MIEDSLDSAADSSVDTLGPGSRRCLRTGSGHDLHRARHRWRLGIHDHYGARRIAMVRTLVEPGPLLTAASRSYVLGLMEHITPSQDWGATAVFPPGVTVALKNGFAVIDGWQINTTGWVSGAGRDYLIAVLTNGNASEQYGIDTVDGVSALVWSALGP